MKREHRIKFRRNGSKLWSGEFLCLRYSHLLIFPGTDSTMAVVEGKPLWLTCPLGTVSNRLPITMSTTITFVCASSENWKSYMFFLQCVCALLFTFSELSSGKGMVPMVFLILLLLLVYVILIFHRKKTNVWLWNIRFKMSAAVQQAVLSFCIQQWWWLF